MKLKEEISNILNEKDLEKKYSLVYDYIYDYAKKQFECEIYCDFKDGKCIANRLNESIHPNNGCCYQYKKGLCEHLKKDGCSIKSVSCQLYMCKYVEDQFKKMKLEKIFPVNKVFNRKQKNIIKRSYFKNKNEVIKLLLESK